MMKNILYFVLLTSVCFSQKITSPKANTSFDYEDYVEIKWDINSYSGDRITVYWSEKTSWQDWQKIDEVNTREGSLFWEVEKNKLSKTNGEIYLIIQGVRGSNDKVKILIDPIISGRRGNLTFNSSPNNVKVTVDGKLAFPPGT